MEHIQITDELLYQYMPVVDAAIIEELESRVDTAHGFSRKFERKMKHLIRKEAHPWLEAVYNVAKWAAILFVSVAGAAFIFTMSVEAYRTKFFETIVTYFEDSILFSYFTDRKATEQVVREPMYIPDGYVEIDRIENENYLSITYENVQGKLILWDQMLVTDGGSMVLDSEYDSKDTRAIHGSSATVFLYEGEYKSGYYEYGESAYMVVAEEISVEDIYKMFESILK